MKIRNTPRRRRLAGLGVAAAGVLGAVLMPSAARADGGVISCIVGEGCTIIPAPGVPVWSSPNPPSPPQPPSGPPEVISCIINEGCFTHPGGGGVDHGHGGVFGGTGDPGIGDTDPFGWLVQDLTYLENLFNTFLSDLFNL